jgi:RNA polymerase sigma-70 factor (ECF subfamily)
VVDDRARALEELYRRRHAALRNGLAPLVGSREAARDVVQEAFARALRERRRYRGEGSLEAWVWKIAFRLALASRRNGREVALDEALIETRLPEPERDPALAAAVATLPPRRRLILFLHYFADLTYHDIAEVCGIAEGTVAASLAQARAALLEALEDEEGR